MAKRKKRVSKQPKWTKIGEVRVTLDQEDILENLMRNMEYEMDLATPAEWYCYCYKDTIPLKALVKRHLIFITKTSTNRYEHEYQLRFAPKGWKQIGLPYLQHLRSLKGFETAIAKLRDTVSATSRSAHRCTRLNLPEMFKGNREKAFEKTLNKVRYLRRLMTQAERQYQQVKTVLANPPVVDLDTLKAEVIAAQLTQ